MNATLTVLDPIAPAAAAAAAQAVRTLTTLHGKIVGFIDNSKPNFSQLADDLGALLVSKYGVAAIVKRSKRSPMRAAPDAVLRELSGQCDVVIAGSGD